MRTVYKYPLNLHDAVQTLRLPQGAQIVRIAIQRHELQLWAFVDTDSPLRDRKYRVFATGQPVPQGFTHIASSEDGSFIWHVFETL